LFFDCLGAPIESFPLHVKLFDLLLQLVVKVHHLRFFFLELSRLLLECSFLHGEVPACILCIVQLFPQFELSLVHLSAELQPAHLYLLELNLELFHFLNRFPFLTLGSLTHPIFIAHDPLDLHLEVDGTVPDVSVLILSTGLF